MKIEKYLVKRRLRIQCKMCGAAAQELVLLGVLFAPLKVCDDWFLSDGKIDSVWIRKERDDVNIISRITAFKR